MSTFKVSVNHSDYTEISESDISSLDCIDLPNNSYHVLKNSKSYHVSFKSKNLNSRTYQVVVNGRDYEVAIQNDLDQLIKSLGFQLGSSKHINQIKAPMPGLILDIHVKPGDDVNEEDPLLILEAMKMENSIVSPTSGKVKSVSVAKGDTVTKNQLLIEFE